MTIALPKVALSINQPWSWLIVAGHKNIENRNWNTSFRGEFLIHAGQNVDRDCAEDLFDQVHPLTRERFLNEHPVPYPTGGMVGIASLIGVVTANTGGRGMPWFVGKYGFMLANARPIEFIPCVGALGFFEPNYDLTYKPKPEPKSRTKAEAPIVRDPQGTLF
jgi:hypothetical protein